MERKTLAAVLSGGAAVTASGIAAAVMLFTHTPPDESGRKVKADVKPDGSVTLTHVTGRQYLDVYVDMVGVPTVCDGITRGVKVGQKRRTEAECTALLERELIIHAEAVMKCTPNLRGRPYQQYAAVSLAYNVGVANYCRSTVDRHFDAGRWRQGCDALLMWNRAGGKVVRGLVLRRERERAVCLQDVR